MALQIATLNDEPTNRSFYDCTNSSAFPLWDLSLTLVLVGESTLQHRVRDAVLKNQ
jgi:hypothetical protein